MTYEITASVRADLCDSYEQYMQKRHIPDVLATGAFSGATFVRSSPGRYRISYHAFSRQSLDEYLATRTQELRAHFNEQFPEGVDLTREEWDVIHQWP